MENARPNGVWMLVARKLAGEASESELLKLQAMCTEDSELGHALKVFSALWNMKEDSNCKEAEQSFERLLARTRRDC
jgi:hypothetical protein